LQIAIKKMPLNAQNIKLLTSEIHIMKESTHPNVVRYLDSYRVEDKLWVRSTHDLLPSTSFTPACRAYDLC
jgi:serine/threonine protein kinase